MYRSEVEKWAEDHGLPRARIFFLVSGPSGSGKTEIIARVLREVPGLVKLVTTTTRHPRNAEEHGREYYFVTRQEFEALIKKGEFVEWKEIFGHYYGLLWKELNLDYHDDVIFDMEVEGRQDFVKIASVDYVTIFLYPPSIEVIRQRLKIRADLTADEIDSRLIRAASEMTHVKEYQYVVENEDLEKAVQQMKALITAERSRRDMQLFRDVYKKTIKSIEEEHFGA